jgi:cadmium resistance protein CadD (predicted permease)
MHRAPGHPTFVTAVLVGGKRIASLRGVPSTPVWSLVLTALLAFVATNVDDLFLLLVLYGQSRFRTLVAGQYIGFVAIVVASWVISRGALLLRREWIGLLGVAPFAIGLKGLLSLRRRDPSDPPDTAKMGVWPIAAVTIADGGDNLAVYAPLFARRTWSELAPILVVFAVMVPIWCALAARLARLPGLASTLQRWGYWVAPLVLLGLGVYIFIAEGTAAYLLARG